MWKKKWNSIANIAEWSERYDCRLLKVEVLSSHTCHKIHRQCNYSCNCWVVYDWETGNDHLEDLHDDREITLSSDLSPHREE